MHRNPCFRKEDNEILGVASDEICYADEIEADASMKLNPSPLPLKADFITEVISSIEDGFLPSARTDLTENGRFLPKPAVFVSKGTTFHTKQNQRETADRHNIGCAFPPFFYSHLYVVVYGLKNEHPR